MSVGGMLRVWILMTTLALATALSSCTSKTGSAAGPMDATAGDSIGTLTYAGSACGTCVAQACAMEFSACNSDPECSAYLSCLQACPVVAGGDVDATCAAACPMGNSSSGAAAEAQVNLCRTTGPGAACPACGLDAGGGAENPIVHQMCTPMMDTTVCFTCEDDNCCKTEAACLADPDCIALTRCLTDCAGDVADDAGSPTGGPPDGGSCELTCSAAHPKGLVEWAPRDACLLVFCAVKCENPPMPPLPTCEACVYEKCADAFANLEGTPEGYLFGSCIAACPSGANACTMACLSQYPSEQVFEQAFYACQTANCPTCM